MKLLVVFFLIGLIYSTNDNDIDYSINIYSIPHYFPDYGLNIYKEDPFGNKYDNYNKGELSQIGINQCKYLAGNIKLKSLDQMITISMRLKRAIDASRIFNSEIYSKYEVTNKNIELKKFNINEFNNINVNNTIYYIPQEYDDDIFSLNFKINKCRKLLNEYESYSERSYKQLEGYFTKFSEILKKNLKNKTFIRHDDEIFTSFLNFTNINFEVMRILAEYQLTHSLINDQKIDEEIFKFKAYDLFYLQNFSDKLGKLYFKGFFKLIIQFIYSKINKEKSLESNLKIINLFITDYHLAALYKMLVKDQSSLPNISYGNQITLNFKSKGDPTSLDNSYVEVYYGTFLQKKEKIIDFIDKLTELMQNINIYEIC